MIRLISSLICILLYTNFENFEILANIEQPSIIWITAEDMSPSLGCFGDEDAISPNIDRFARESVKFTNVFASAPVCSPPVPA